ncbi:hypothetical protein FWH13_02540 [Candidatus Saccharibacteria bacterium]|nr:hypothetical protein [Candidatus Saccharibacteria bacterium]
MQHKNRNIILGTAGAAVLILTFILIGLTVSLQRQLRSANIDVEARIHIAETEARMDERERAEAEWAILERATTHAFSGPDVFGQLSLFYPRAWSLFVQSTAQQSSGDFVAFMHPRLVTAGQQVYALRVSIVSRSYEQVLQEMNHRVQQGTLTSSPFRNELGAVGMRFDGQFVHGQAGGAAVILQIRDRTAIIQTDTEIFKGDFNQIITTITYNP